MSTTKRQIGLWPCTLAALWLSAIAPAALSAPGNSDVTLPGDGDLVPATINYGLPPVPLTPGVQSVRTETGMAAWPSGASGSMLLGGGDFIGRLPLLPPQLYRSPTWTQFAPRAGTDTGATAALHYDLGPLSVAGISAIRLPSANTAALIQSDRTVHYSTFHRPDRYERDSSVPFRPSNSDGGVPSTTYQPVSPPAPESSVPASPVASSSSIATYTPVANPTPMRSATTFNRSPDDQDSLTLAVGITIFGSMIIAAFWLMRSPGRPPSGTEA